MKELVSLFSSSPLEALKTHMDICVQCAEGLKDVITVQAAGREEALVNVKRLENEADEIKSDVRKKMSRRLFMPVSREHLLELVQAQDKIANRARDIAILFTHRFDVLPESIVAMLHDLLDKNLEVIRLAREGVQELDELVETGFRGAEAELVERLVDRLEALESESDTTHWDFFSKMKKVEDQLPPIDAMFVYRISNLIAELGDRANQTGRKLGQLLTR